MQYILLVLRALLCVSVAVQPDQKVVGTYYCVSDRFEQYSRITLKPEGVFMYTAGTGGCQIEVTGRWRAEKNKLYLINDKEFQSNSADTSHYYSFYPDMSLTAWTISLNALKPLHPVNSGCVVANKKHIRGRQ
jgi:hypothetical protein